MGKVGVGTGVVGVDVAAWVERHLGEKGIEKALHYSLGELRAVCEAAAEVLAKEPSLLQLHPPICVAGNINGQYRDLLAALCAGGWPPGINSNWLFLGDYISRGSRSLECICLLLGLKLLFPRNVFLLRGHHEDPDMASHFGFKAEVDRRLGISNAWELFKPVLEAFPVAAVIGRPPRRILALHGGISPGGTLADIAAIQRPTTLPRQGLLTDLLWADFDPLTDNYADSHRGISHKFGERALKRFCRLNDLALLIRSHQLVQQGFQFSGPAQRLLTLWTATNYNAEFNNAGAIALISRDSQLTLKVLMMEAEEEAEVELVAASLAIPAPALAAKSLPLAPTPAQPTGTSGDGPEAPPGPAQKDSPKDSPASLLPSRASALTQAPATKATSALAQPPVSKAASAITQAPVSRAQPSAQAHSERSRSTAPSSDKPSQAPSAYL